MIMKPKKPEAPSVERNMDDSIRIVWEGFSNSKGTEYEVYMAVDVGGGSFELLTTTEEAYHTVYKKRDAQKY